MKHIAMVESKTQSVSKSYLVAVLIAACLNVAVIYLFQSNWQKHQTSEFFPPPPFLEHLHFGERWSLADLMWIRALQDFDTCDKKNDVDGKSKCSGNTWIFKMIDAITDLDPQHEVVHSAGALSLSVFVEDFPGASKIYDKAVSRYPKKWGIQMQAAFHYMENMHDNARAAKLLESAGANGAPNWVYSLAVRLYSQDGQKELAARLYDNLKEQGFPEDLLERIKNKALQGKY